MAQNMLGLLLPPSATIASGLTACSQLNADFCIVTLADANIYTDDSLNLLRASGEWATRICGRVSASSWSASTIERIEFEISTAAHFGLSGVVVPLPPNGFASQCVTSTNNTNTNNTATNVSAPLDITAVASLLLRHCNSSTTTKIIIDVGCGGEGEWETYRALLSALNVDPFTSSGCRWDTLTSVRAKRGAHGMINALVSMGSHSGFPKCWCGERLSGFILPNTAVVGAGSWDEPTVGDLLRRRSSPILNLYDEAPEQLSSIEVLDRVGYELHELNRLYFSQKDSGADNFMTFEDTLQLPLQPLGDHLPNPTYGVFEADKVKYTAYQMAFEDYLVHLAHSSDGAKQVVRVAVLGAGRGPLVTSILNASSSVSARLTTQNPIALAITIIEKNPHAVKFLEVRMREDPLWCDAVANGTAVFELLPGDGRDIGSALGTRKKEVGDLFTWPLDVVVSELLGSFGDNELSPECIEGFMSGYTNSSEGRQRPACIPREYTSVAAPVYSGVLLERVRELCLRGGTVDCEDPMNSFHSTYVVQALRHLLLADPKPVMTFRHGVIPGSTGTFTPDAFSQSSTVVFQAAQDGVLHGFMGYFQCVLFNEDQKDPGGGVLRGESTGPHLLSTNPASHTDEMYSWFPLFIPLVPQHRFDKGRALRVCKGDIITLWLTRRHDGAGVWYEWQASVGEEESAYMNRDGVGSKIRL